MSTATWIAGGAVCGLIASGSYVFVTSTPHQKPTTAAGVVVDSVFGGFETIASLFLVAASTNVGGMIGGAIGLLANAN